MEREDEKINVWGARVHNLKDIDVEIPRNSLTVITGLSGSGKSSLAFDTIYAEGQRRYIETFSSYARGMLGALERPDVDNITGLSPVIAIEQKTINRNPRSTIGTTTEIYDYLRLLYARVGVPHCPVCGKEMEVNLRKDNFFVEDEKWHEMHDNYSKFLEKIEPDDRLVLLELGVGFNTPIIIRYPFEQMTHDNPNVTLIRLNRSYAQAIPENKNKTISALLLETMLEAKTL